jgi:hypothetical protein
MYRKQIDEGKLTLAFRLLIPLAMLLLLYFQLLLRCRDRRQADHTLLPLANSPVFTRIHRQRRQSLSNRPSHLNQLLGKRPIQVQGCDQMLLRLGMLGSIGIPWGTLPSLSEAQVSSENYSNSFYAKYSRPC